MTLHDEKLRAILSPLFEGDTVVDETVLFLEEGDEKRLLFDADRVLSVTSYDLSVTYEEGRDYALRGGRLVLLPGSRIPHMGKDAFYHYEGSIISVMHDGERCPMYWGEGTSMTRWQVKVTYTHSDGWKGFVQPGHADVYAGLLAGLEAGRDVTVMFHGDSITYGANASALVGGGTNQPSFPILAAEAMADAYGYRVRFIDPKLGNTPAVPADAEYGTRGTLTFINTAVGGWNSGHGVQYFDSYIRPFVEAYGCDLFVLGYGMNDGGADPETVTVKNLRTTLDGVRALAPDCALCAVATMVPNPDGIGWSASQPKQEPFILRMAEVYRASGVPCAVAQMTSVSLAVLERKQFMDYTGNNVNHPNDFFGRIYADTILRTLLA